jgi:putative transposase
MIEALRKVIKRMDYPLEVMRTCVRWYVTYPPNLRHIEEMIVERGIFGDHATVYCWVLKIVTALAKAFRGQWKYLYRAVDRDGDAVVIW